MAWKTDIVLMLRHIIDDLDCPQTYSDIRLQQLIALAAQKVLGDVDIEIEYEVVFGKNPSITPDPTENGDYVFVNLITLKAACIIDHAETKRAAQNAIMFRDAEAWGDAREVGKHRQALLKIGVCKEYDEAVVDFQMGNISNVGVAVLSPFRLYGRP